MKNKTNVKSLIPFFFGSQKVRTWRDDKGQLWFVAKDVCAVLGIFWNGDKTLNIIPEQWKGVGSFTTIKGKQNLKIINEAGLYKFVFRSNKPEAERFTDWVASEVLPQIRETGKYELRQYVSEGSIPYESRFPKTFFQAICSLYKIAASKVGNKTVYPSICSHIINKYVYGRFPHKEVLPELRRLNPRIGKNRQHKHHQNLTPEKGLRFLDQHIISVQTLLLGAESPSDFKERFERVFPENPDERFSIVGMNQTGDGFQLSFDL